MPSTIATIGDTIYERAYMLDTGPLVSLFDQSDARGKIVQMQIEQIQDDKAPIFITKLTVAEAHRRILFDVGYNQAYAFLANIHDGQANIMETEDTDTIEAIAIIAKYDDHDITYTDAVSMAVMKRVGIHSILTFDYHFSLLGFNMITCNVI